MSIATRIEAIEEHLTDDYSVLELAGADLTNVDKNIFNLKPTWKERLLYYINYGTDIVWNNWEKVFAEGTSLTLNNTEEATMKIDLKGNTYQDSTTGKNILNGANPTSANSATVSMSGNIITVSSTSTNTSPFVRYQIDNLQEGDVYRLNGIIKSSNGRFAIQEYNGSWSTKGSTDYIDGTSISSLSYTASSGITSIRFLVYASKNVPTEAIQCSYENVIVTKNNSDMTYEPYTNGASPNQSYPQPVHGVSGYNTIEVVGKNLWNEIELFGSYLDDGFYKFTTAEVRDTNNNVISLKSGFKENTQYTLSCRGYFSGSVYAGFRYHYTDETTSQAYMPNGTNGAYSVTSTAGKTIDYIEFFNVYNSTGKSTFIEQGTFQLEEGSDTTYEPYQGTSYPITLKGKNILKPRIGDYTFPTQNLNVKLTDKGFLANGTTNSNGNVTIFRETLPAGTYTINGVTGGANNTYQAVVYKDGSVIKYVTTANQTFTLDASALIEIRIYLYSAKGTFDNLLLPYQLVEGSTIGNYEPYFTPLECYKIGDYQDRFFKTSGKNLIPFTNQDFTLNNVRYYVVDGNLYLDGTSTSETSSSNQKFIDNFSFTLEAGTYTISHRTGILAVYFRNATTNTNIQTLGKDTASTTITLNETTNVNIGFYVYQNSFTNASLEIMIEKNSNATSYEPYGTNEWYLEKKIGKKVFTGSEDEGWNLFSSGDNSFYYASLTNYLYIGTVPQYALCNIFKNVSISSSNTNVGFYMTNSNNIRFREQTMQTIDNWKTWLGSNNMNLYYVLSTPTYTKITWKLKDQLEEVYRAMAKNGQTNILQENADLPFIINASALKEM